MAKKVFELLSNQKIFPLGQAPLGNEEVAALGRSSSPKRNFSTSGTKAPSSIKDEKRNPSSSTEGESGSERTRFSKSKVGSGKRSADQRFRNSKDRPIPRTESAPRRNNESSKVTRIP